MTRTTLPDEVLRAENLQYRYGAGDGYLAVRGLDLTVRRGEIYALLGTNGAGKTTTLQMLEGTHTPTAGRVRVLGVDPRDRKTARPRMGMMMQESGSASDLTAVETARLAGAISGRNDEAARVLDLVDLGHRAHTRVAQLSGGEKRRLDFACAAWGTPELLFLDEPTTGLDSAARARLWDVVGELRSAGTTVILTTHYLDEAERHADRIGILQDGVLQREGTLAEIVAAAQSTITVAAPEGYTLPLPIAETVGSLARIHSGDLQRDLLVLLQWADAAGVVLERLSASSASLDDLFLSLEREMTR